MTIDRYGLSPLPDGAWMEPNEKGGWVSYVEHASLLAQARTLAERWHEQLRQLQDAYMHRTEELNKLSQAHLELTRELFKARDEHRALKNSMVTIKKVFERWDSDGGDV